jgi:phage-related protein
MTVPGPRKMADVAWEGDSRVVLSGFPDDVKVSFGFSLRLPQKGETPACKYRSMTSVGDGVWELKESDDQTWYRVMYLSTINNVIHVLHCFEKSSSKTPQRDINTARARLVLVKQRLQDERKKRKS